jgi:hypothetical protein
MNARTRYTDQSTIVQAVLTGSTLTFMKGPGSNLCRITAVAQVLVVLFSPYTCLDSNLN